MSSILRPRFVDSATAEPVAPRRSAAPWALGVFILLVAAAAVFGSRFEPGAWYAALRKPPLNPPNWLFAPAWSALYLCIAAAGWLVWRSPPPRGRALGLWGAQLALNAAWSWLFFGLHLEGFALVEIGTLLVLVVATTVVFFRVRPAAGALFVPYAAWIGFATYLNAGLWLLNR